MKRPVVVLDCDGVLLDWTKGFGRWLEKTKGLPVDPRGPFTYDLVNWIGAAGNAEAIDWIEEFNASDAFGQLESCWGAVLGVHRLAEFCDLHVVTSCGKDCAEKREENLRDTFGPTAFKSITCIGLTDNKINHLAAMINGGPSFFIEDNLGNALDGLLCGHQPIMLRRRWNEAMVAGSPAAVTWFDTLNDAVPHVQRVTGKVKITG